jgi:hypothetical protein
MPAICIPVCGILCKYAGGRKGKGVAEMVELEGYIITISNKACPGSSGEHRMMIKELEQQVD